MAEVVRQTHVMRLFLALIVLGMLAGTVSSIRGVHGQEAEGTIRMSPDFSSVRMGDGPFSIFIVIEDLNHRDIDRGVVSEGLAAFEYTVQYDPAVIEVVESTLGPTIESTGRTFQCFDRRDEPGSFSYGCVSPGTETAGPQGSFTLSTLTLEPVGGGSTFLLLSAGAGGPLGEDVPVSVIGVGIVDVEGDAAATRTPPPPTATQQPPTATSRPGASTATPATEPTVTRAPTQPGETPATDETAEPDTTASPAATDEPRGTETPLAPSGDGGGDDGSAGLVIIALVVAGVAVAGGAAGAAFLWQRRGVRQT